MLAVTITKTSLRRLTSVVATAIAPLLISGCVSTSSVPVTTTASHGGFCADPGCTTGVCAPEMMATPGCNCPTGMVCPPGGCGDVGCGDTGCGDVMQCSMNCEVPRELRKTAFPEYRVEAPDVLLIEAANNLRPPTAPILAGEPLLIQVDRTIPVDATADKVAQAFKTINGPYVIGTDGYLNLGPEDGKVLCAG